MFEQRQLISQSVDFLSTRNLLITVLSISILAFLTFWSFSLFVLLSTDNTVLVALIALIYATDNSSSPFLLYLFKVIDMVS